MVAYTGRIRRAHNIEGQIELVGYFYQVLLYIPRNSLPSESQNKMGDSFREGIGYSSQDRKGLGSRLSGVRFTSNKLRRIEAKTEGKP